MFQAGLGTPAVVPWSEISDENLKENYELSRILAKN